MTTPSNTTIQKLSQSGKTVSPVADDIRGYTVKDKHGKAIGKVHDLLIDEGEQKVRFLLVEHGGFLGFGQTTSFIPVDAITQIKGDEVVINHSREHVADAPPYDPELISGRDYHRSIYDYYGYDPFWSREYMYPANGGSMGLL